MPLVAMHASFSLLEVNRVAGKVPMDNGMAVRVEI
jgi:hypothetical protein